MKIIFLCCAAVLLFAGCNKSNDPLTQKQSVSVDPSQDFFLYIIKQGQHYANDNSFKAVELSELKFLVKFDSSAIYETADEFNQDDINKLYGFSDNSAEHHQYSARFGWSWNKNALRLYAYVYTEGHLTNTELGIAPIGEVISCSIKASGGNYVFAMNDQQIKMPRSSFESMAKGYMLYPYFGGDEPAPHDIHIWIKNL